MDIKDILQSKVSFQSSAWSPLSKEMTIEEVLSEIRVGKYHRQIDYLRNFLRLGNEEGYNIYKKSLPAVTFCATFKLRRTRDLLKKYNYLMVLDIDKLDKEELKRIKKTLENDNYVFSFWESPSQKGVKGLVFISYDFKLDMDIFEKSHKCAFKKIAMYFFKTYNIKLDDSGSDSTRLCFLSYDPKLILKQTIDTFPVLQSDITSAGEENEKKEKKDTPLVNFKSTKDSLHNPKNKNFPENRKSIQSIIKYLTKKGFSITDSYEEWYRVAFAIANSFTIDIGEKYYLALCKLDGDRYDEVNSRNLLNYCYGNSRNKIKFSTILYFANQKGYKNNSQKGEVPKTAVS